MVSPYLLKMKGCVVRDIYICILSQKHLKKCTRNY